jgi:hypothetical protein
MASSHNIVSLVWEVAKKTKTQETPNNNKNKNGNNNFNNFLKHN